MVMSQALDYFSRVEQGRSTAADAKKAVMDLMPALCEEFVPSDLRQKFSDCVVNVLDHLVAFNITADVAKIELSALVGAAMRGDGAMLKSICPPTPWRVDRRQGLPN